ncbi:hypothetical protein PV11_02438 [Exophiala sideris]|uniref:Uncharacterized protein n=1 Tax=Exophiala sideris TaxID=1016849 RepID=A0A0D1WDJ7_9EURO|nr:hypothetical protein PV11_02438 [Exophiala sideris]
MSFEGEDLNFADVYDFIRARRVKKMEQKIIRALATKFCKDVQAARRKKRSRSPLVTYKRSKTTKVEKRTKSNTTTIKRSANSSTTWVRKKRNAVTRVTEKRKVKPKAGMIKTRVQELMQQVMVEERG